MIDDFFDEFYKKNEKGTLTVGETLIGHYYRLLDGPNAGRVIINSYKLVDEKKMC